MEDTKTANGGSIDKEANDKEAANKSPASSSVSSVDTSGVASELKKLNESLARIESLTVANSKLEKEQKDMESMLSSQLEIHKVEKAQLESKLAATNRENLAEIESLKESIKCLQSQVNDLQKEKEALIKQIEDCQKAAMDAHLKVVNSEKVLQAMRTEWETEKSTLQEQATELKQVNDTLSQQLEGHDDVADELRRLLDKNNTLKTKIKEYESKIDKLENNILPESESQLELAREDLRKRVEAFDKVKQQVSEYETNIEDLKRELSNTKAEREEERINFQKLNEDSSQAFDMMQVEVNDKSEHIKQLAKSLEDVKALLDLEKHKMEEAKQNLKGTQNNLNLQIVELKKGLDETTIALEDSEQEKGKLATKLEKALEQIDADTNFKEQMVSKSKETSQALDYMVSERNKLQSRIKELESQLHTTLDERDNAQDRLNTFDEREAELFRKLREGDRVRRDLHNRVMQLSGNIRVFVRVRPKLPSEEGKIESADIASKSAKKRKHDEVECSGPFKYPGIYDRTNKKSNYGADDLTKNVLEVTEPYKDRGGLSDRRKKWTFGFDNVFTPDHGQDDLWEATEPLVQSAIDGFNVTIFAYGQTGSGKTFTMLGEEGNEGLISRSIRKLFEAKSEIELLSRGETQVDLSVELLEIYNEKVRDLLAANGGPDGREVSLKIKSNEVVGNLVVPVKDEDQVAKILDLAQKRRCVKATSSNAVSSRSHMLFTIRFNVTSKSGAKRSGKLNVCDLAGSERLNKSNANAHGVSENGASIHA